MLLRQHRVRVRGSQPFQETLATLHTHHGESLRDFYLLVESEKMLNIYEGKKMSKRETRSGETYTKLKARKCQKGKMEVEKRKKILKGGNIKKAGCS